MSERFIFNKKLNRTNPVWYWLIALALSLFAFKSLSQQEAVVLVDLKRFSLRIARCAVFASTQWWSQSVNNV